MRIRRGASALMAVLTAVALPADAASQRVEELAAGCTSAGGAAPRCIELAVAARALQGHVGLLAGLGSEVAGSASTLGRRLGTTPRVAVGARAGFAHVGLPDLADPGTEPSRESTFILPSIRAGVTVGVFDGFSLLPTVGGFLGVDLLAHGSVVFLPAGEGFEGRATALTYGLRIGLLRESFTLPGVSISVARRSLGNVAYGSVASSGGGAVEVDPGVTSIRATVGKDLLAVGLLAGVGWDRYSGSATIHAATDGTDVSHTLSTFDNSRRLLFGGAAINFLVLQLSAEVGWAGGFDAVSGYRGAPFDPTAGTLYGSIAFRLTI